MTTKPRSVEWLKFFEILLLFLVVPTAIFALIATFWPIFLKFGYFFIISLFVFQSGLSYLYSLSALPRKKFHELATAEHKTIPKTTFIVSAYLPNEVDVIEDTLANILERIERPRDGIEIILAYNTPQLEPIEIKLRDLCFKWPELILANAYGSRSKSENLNYALDLASGEMIVLIDADHLVSRDCLRRAWRWLDEGYGVVQGRCKIRNGDKSPVAALVEVEFEAIYGISHFAKSRLFDSTLFGGTNGYWRNSVIKATRFRPDRLTEDIDSTLRAILHGIRIVHDRSIISTELAPETPGALWFQRKRWAQGWFQCSVNYQIAIWTSQYLNIFQKFMWTTLLMWRVAYDILSHFLFPIVFAHWLNKGIIDFPINGYVWFALYFTLLSGPFEAMVAFKDATRPRASALRYIYYALMIFPYTLFKNTLQLVAMKEELAGKREWNITQRAKS